MTLSDLDIIKKLREITKLPILQVREFIYRKKELSERIILASELQSDHIFHDPAEDEEPLKSIIKLVMSDVENEYERFHAKEEEDLINKGLHSLLPLTKRGACHWIWSRVQKRLREEYGIRWFTPSEMNPGSKFD